jgi:PPOX class probable F420-dependent enzyme
MPLPNPTRDTYVNLATFRRDGREVCTPVWIAGVAGRFYAFSAGDAGKVKRIRANDRVRLATCDLRGNVKSDWVEARARVLSDDAEIAAALKALRSKYGLQMWTSDFFSKLSGRFKKRAYLEIEVA